MDLTLRYLNIMKSAALPIIQAGLTYLHQNLRSMAIVPDQMITCI